LRNSIALANTLSITFRLEREITPMIFINFKIPNRVVLYFQAGLLAFASGAAIAGTTTTTPYKITNNPSNWGKGGGETVAGELLFN